MLDRHVLKEHQMFLVGDACGDVLDLGDVVPGLTLTVDDFFAPLAADWE